MDIPALAVPEPVVVSWEESPVREFAPGLLVWFAMYSRYAGDWDNFAKSSGLLTRPWASTGIVTSSSLSTRSPGMSPEGSCFTFAEVSAVGSIASGFAAERCVPGAVVHVATVMGEAGNHTKNSPGMDPHEAAVTLPAARASARRSPCAARPPHQQKPRSPTG